MKKILIPLVTLFAIGFFTIDSNASGEKPSKAEQKAAQMQTLSQEKQNALYVITTEYLRERQPIEQTLAQKQAEIQALMRQNNPNVKQAGELAAEISTLEYTLMNMSMRFHHQLAIDFDMPMSNCSNNGCPDAKIRRKSGH